jgi:hypothetical protein
VDAVAPERSVELDVRRNEGCRNFAGRNAKGESLV